MPAPSLLKGLPKPLLFALYGGLAGLIGTVLLGEPVWQFLKPLPPPPAPALPPAVAVSASASVQVYPGTSNTFTVQVARVEFTGPVAVKFSGLPAWVKIEPVTVAAGSTQGVATVTAGRDAAVGTTNVTVAADGESGAIASTTIELIVAPTPKPPPRLAVAASPGLQVYRGGSCKFTVQVARADFDGPVDIDIGPLPAGLTLPPLTIGAGKTEAEVTLKADATAAVTISKLRVAAEANAGTLIRATTETSVSVQMPPPIPVDIMFVLDCSASMEPFIEGVKDGIIGFVKELSSKQIDYRLGLLAFRDRIFGQEPELLTFEKGEPFTKDTKLFSKQVGQLTCMGNDTIPESALDAVVESARQPFRQQGATKVLLLITDAPPLVPDKDTRTVKEAADVLKEKNIDQLHLVLRRNDQRAYKELHDAVTGKHFDLQRVTSGGEKFATILPELSKAIAETVAARPGKAEVAAPPPPPVVAAAAAAVPTASAAAPPPPEPTVKSLQSSEESAAGSEARLVVRSGVWAGLIAALVCLALLAGQHHYLKGKLPAVGGAIVGVLGGLAAGLVGGAAGQGLYLLALTNAPNLGVASQVLGWMLLGGLAGAGLSLFIPNMKWYLGLAGGALGGAVGAAGFLVVTNLAGDLAGRLVGGLAVGFCIGLMVAVVEAAFRRAWLEVRYGTRETITVTLGPEPVKVGGDNRVCTVWARGAAPLALRYFLRDGQVICEDTVMKRETIVADGNAKEVGNVTVTVRMGGGAGSPAATATPTRTLPHSPPRSVSHSSGSVGLGSGPLPLDDDPEPLPLPSGSVTATSPKSVAPSASSRPVTSSIPIAASKPALPPVPTKPPPPGATRATPPTLPPAGPRPTAPPGPKHPDACPGCGRVNAGAKKARYCMVCDLTY